MSNTTGRFDTTRKIVFQPVWVGKLCRINKQALSTGITAIHSKGRCEKVSSSTSGGQDYCRLNKVTSRLRKRRTVNSSILRS